MRKGKLRVIDWLWCVGAGRRGSGRLANLQYGGFKMRSDLNEMLRRQFFVFGTCFMEEKILDCWTKAAKGARVIFDIGANAGIYSLAALASEPAAVVHAFEPTPEIASKLRATTRLNCLDNFLVHGVAVSRHGGQAILRRFKGELGTNEGMNYICAESDAPNGEHVQTVCLDEFCEKRSITHIDLPKLDVQGHEHSVLQGGEGLIKFDRLRAIFMELNWASHTAASCPATESGHLLAQAGYHFAAPDDCTNWRQAGSWLKNLNDVMARRFEKS